MKTSERLLVLVQEVFPLAVRVERLYPGYWQRSAGAWSWWAVGEGWSVGSADSMTECVRRGITVTGRGVTTEIHARRR